MTDNPDAHRPAVARTQFATPSEIERAPNLSDRHKIDLLHQWEQDLRQQLTASREGMAPPEPNRTPETLRQVRALLRRLGAAPNV